MCSGRVPSHYVLVQNENNELSFSSMSHFKLSDKFLLSLGEMIFLLNKIVCQMHIYMYLTIKNFHSIFCGLFRFIWNIAISIKFSTRRHCFFIFLI